MILGRLRHQSKYLTIQYFSTEKHWDVRWMCAQLGISRASYYKWLKRDIPAAEKENMLIAQLVKEYDERFDHILGYRRMTSWINRLNSQHYSQNRIHRIMKKLGIRSVIRRKANKYKHSSPDAVADNILKRDFNASRPNEKWATDVTEFKWYEDNTKHKLYLSAIIDLYDKSIISYVVSGRNDNKLTLDTFQKAIAENPDAKPIFHSDRGFNYTSKQFQFKLIEQGMTPSMSRIGHCIDNCPTEGFWGIVKSEMYYLNKFENEVSLREAIDKYIYFYNNERFQDRFGTKTPMEVRIAALSSDCPEAYPIAENKRVKKFKAKFAA